MYLTNISLRATAVVYAPATMPSETSTSVPEPLLTPTEVSTWLRVPVKTLTAWRSHRKGPRYLRVGVDVRYRAADVERWLQLQE